MTKAVVYHLRVLVEGGGYYASIEEEILFWEEVEGRDGHAFVVETLHVDFIGISTEVYKEFHVFDNRPVNQPLCLVPQQPLKHLGSLAETQSSIVVVRSLFQSFPNFVKFKHKIFIFIAFIFK